MFRSALCLCFAGIWALPSCPDIHTWHNVTAFRGTWKAQLASLSEKALFYSPNCTDMGASPTFEVVGGQSVASGSATFGFKIAEGDTFDVAYSLTLVRRSAEPLHPHKDVDGNANQDGGRKLFKSMACSYVIAAAGPAQPDVRAEPFNGATCLWERNEGVGENYQVDFSPEDEQSSVSLI